MKFSILSVNSIFVKAIVKIILCFLTCHAFAQQVAVLKYSGGGDWYANPTAVPNLVKFTNAHIKTALDTDVQVVSPTDQAIFNYPVLFMTGHGHVSFTDDEITKLKTYLKSGGFLHISDNYGMDRYIRPLIAELFPNQPLTELPNDHPIFHQTFNFPQGLPKIHEHDKKRPQALGVFYEGRLVILYDFECDLSDGWEDPAVHNDPEEVRMKALKMGANIIEYAFKH